MAGQDRVRTLYIEPRSPWEKGYCESFNGKLRDELVNGKIFYTMREAEILIGRWRAHYTRSGPTTRWAIAHRRLKPSCLAMLVCSRSAPVSPLPYPADRTDGAGQFCDGSRTTLSG